MKYSSFLDSTYSNKRGRFTNTFPIVFQILQKRLNLLDSIKVQGSGECANKKEEKEQMLLMLLLLSMNGLTLMGQSTFI